MSEPTDYRANVTELRLGDSTFRIMHGYSIPAGHVLFVNNEGWAAFLRGDKPRECDAALIVLDNPTTPQPRTP